MWGRPRQHGQDFDGCNNGKTQERRRIKGKKKIVAG